MKKNRREADLKENKKQSMREIEDRAIEIGMKVHNEVQKHYCTSEQLQCLFAVWKVAHCRDRQVGVRPETSYPGACQNPSQSKFSSPVPVVRTSATIK